MNPVIDYLVENKLLGKRGPIIKTIESLSLSKIVDISQNIENITKKNHKPVLNSITTHSASSALGGGSDECSFVGCRIERITKLSRFSLLYSDKVFIDNFLTGYTHLDDTSELDTAKQKFYEDLVVIDSIRPIINYGCIDFYSSEKNICFSCQAKKFIGDQAGKYFDKAYDSLKTDYLKNMSVKAKIVDESIDFQCIGPEPFFDHEKIQTSDIIPNILLNKPTMLKRLIAGDTVSIPKNLIKELGLNNDFAHGVVSDAIANLVSSNSLKTSFLTDNELHIRLVNDLQDNYEISRRNQIAEKYLTTIVPFLEDVDFNNLIKLRKREDEAFILFRKSINDSIDEVLSASDKFSEKDAKTMYSDIIAPSLANLDNKVKKSKKDLITKPIRSLIGVSGVLSFGLLTGLIPPNVSEAVKVLGLLKFGSDLIKETIAVGDGEKEISRDNYYFLWKLRKTKK